MNPTPKKFFLTLIFVLIIISSFAQKEINQYEPQATFERGVLLFENHHYASALECFENYLSVTDSKNSQNAVVAEYYAAVSSLYLGNSKGENKILAFVKHHPTSLMANHANYIYANSLFQEKKYRNALKVYNETNAEDLNDDEYYDCKFKTAYCYFQTNNIEEATPVFKELANVDNKYRDDAKYYYAHILYVNNEMDEALQMFGQLRNNKVYGDVSKAYELQINFDRADYAFVCQNGDEILEVSKKKRKADIALMMAESQYQLGDYAKSLEYYNIALDNSTRRLPREIEFKMGFCKMKTSDYEGAIEHFSKVTDKNDKLGQYGSYYMAQCYTNTDQDKFARNTFFKAYKMNFNDTLSENALLNYAALSFIPGIDPFIETVTAVKEYIDNNPQSAKLTELQEILVYLYLNSNDYDNALKTMEKYSVLSQELLNIQSELTYKVGIQAYQKADYEQAISSFKKSLQNPNLEPQKQAEALFWLADSYNQKKDVNNAYKNYQLFVKSSQSSKSELYPLAYYNMGYINLDKGDFDNALSCFKNFINHDDSDKLRQNDAWLRIGDSYFIQRQYANAITAYSNAVKMSNKNEDYAYYQQAMGYGALGKTNEKISCLNIVVNKHKKSSFYDKALFEMGMAYQTTDDNRSAITSFEKLVDEKPRSPYARKALLKIGMIYYNNNENDKAVEKLKGLVAQYPNTEEAKESVNIIANIYKEKNDIQSYFDYIEENKLAVISVDKQDSITFVTIDDFYAKRNYAETLKGVKQYLENYPNGAYLLKVHYYAMKSMENLDEMDEIRTHIEYILSQPDNDYTDNALLLMARLEYDASNYPSSAEYYERLAEITENQNVMLEAMEGAMKSYYFDKQFDKAIENANKLLLYDELGANQVNQANYIMAKSYYDKKDYAEALKYFDLCANPDNKELGAECGYYSASSLYLMGEYDSAEEKIFYVSDNFNSYIYWTACSFIVLSDVYVAKDNAFQAKETLKSVIDNYPQDGRDYEGIIRLSQDKLNQINVESNE